MKKQAVCIQCHNKPEQINFLIEHMPEEYFDFYIHVDEKSNILKEIHKKKNVCFSKRIDVRWGRFSQIEATLEMLRMIDTSQYCYVHLISGNDYIIKSVDYICDFFTKQNGAEFIESNILPGKCTWSWKGCDRFQCWYPQWMIHRPINTVFRCIRVFYREFIMRTKVFTRKKYPVKEFYGGSQWFSITGECVKWMLEYLSQHQEYINFFKHGVCVDEVFFATLIRISPYSKNIIGDNMRFMIWKDGTTGGPKELRSEHILQLKESKYIFARKFTDLDTIKIVQEQLEK